MDYIVIDTKDGPKPWRKLSSRVFQFNENYPVKEGFRVVFKQQDALSCQQGLLKLYETAIRAGVPLEKSGLPPLKDVTTMIMEASLLNKEGTVLATGSAAGEILEHKDWEQLESAARQRLLAALGYNGDLLDTDEAAAIALIAQKNGVLPRPVPTGVEITGDPVSAPSTARVQIPEPVIPVESRIAAATPDGATDKAPPQNGAPASPQQEETGKVHTLKGKKVPASIQNQLKQLARLKGVPVPEFTDVDDALRKIAELRGISIADGQETKAVAQ